MPQVLFTPSFSSTAATRGWTGSPGELKFVDVASAAYACDTTGSVTALNLVAQGDDVTNRQGRQITLKSCRVLGKISGGITTTPVYCRVMLVWDSQPNSGAIATIAQIMAASTSISNPLLDNRERFTILRDWKMTLGGLSTTATQSFAMSPSNAELDWYVPLKGIKTTYSGTTATIGVVATGALLLVTLGDLAAGSGGVAQLVSRVRFIDN
jgi:hypothetical protein